MSLGGEMGEDSPPRAISKECLDFSLCDPKMSLPDC